MDVELVKGLLETIRNAMVSNKRNDDVAVPIFDPDKGNDGTAAWCESFDKLGDEFKWSSFEKVAKAGKAHRGSALSWFETWEPETVNHEKASKKILCLVNPQNKIFSEKLLNIV
ncbi:unnamed protein product [Parnassius apollo]|uniref:(apollo) hypothetical protein n=1 Tax=Parnassius apollo TaxID=110799 RepID=A0A8S3W0L2_PARAO|nr:unnamed protein product [Parnassius apollo]